MSSSRFMTAFLVFMTTIVALYIFMATFGGVMDSLQIKFTDMLVTLALPTAWNAIALKILTYWTYVWKCVVAICISLGVWVVRSAIVDLDYARQQM